MSVLKFKRIIKKDISYYLGKKYDGMMGRCYRESDRSFKSYGDKGIKVCSSWITDIESFRTWAKTQLEAQGISEETFVINSKKIQLDRIDPTGHYTPVNCRFSNPQRNTRNRNLNKGKILISAEGTEIKFGD